MVLLLANSNRLLGHKQVKPGFTNYQREVWPINAELLDPVSFVWFTLDTFDFKNHFGHIWRKLLVSYYICSCHVCSGQGFI